MFKINNNKNSPRLLWSTLPEKAVIVIQLALICSKSKIEILEKGVEYVWKITIKTPKRRQWRRSDVFTINFEHISHLFLMFLFLTLNKHMFARKGWRRRYTEGWGYMLIQWQCFLRKLRLLKAVQLDFHVFVNYILYILFYWFHMFYWT